MRMTKICLADSILEKFDGSDDCEIGLYNSQRSTGIKKMMKLIVQLQSFNVLCSNWSSYHSI